jgi:IS1 family transposase
MEKCEEVQSSPKEYRINRRHNSVQRMPAGSIDREKQIERRKSSVRSKGGASIPDSQDIEHDNSNTRRHLGRFTRRPKLFRKKNSWSI